MALSLRELNDKVKKEASFVEPLLTETRRVIVGQEALLHRLLIALLCDGHVLIEGVPGLAKTLAVRTLASAIQVQFQRIQFTPDLLPSDLIGTQIYHPGTGEFRARKGPIFSQIVLADEINRAPAKVQSALLEAMEERQVTLGDETFPLADPFLVLATQNPLEQEGTYPLPEAQLDRFMFKVIVTYPTRAQEREVLQRMTGEEIPSVKPILDADRLRQARKVVRGVYVDDKIHEYVLDIISATRQPAEHGLKNLATLLEVGGSPRATLWLVKAAKAHAFLSGRGYVTPDDIKRLAPDILRHRIQLSFEAQADGVTAPQIIQKILNTIQVP
jgi:MoxR-like ATPase